MAQDELTRLQKSLANYQSKNTSGQYASTVASIENKINNLKGQIEATPTNINTPQNQSAVTKTATPTSNYLNVVGSAKTTPVNTATTTPKTQYTQAQLEAQLKNAQARLNPNSITGQATINRITNELNAIKSSSTPTNINTPQNIQQQPQQPQVDYSQQVKDAMAQQQAQYQKMLADQQAQLKTLQDMQQQQQQVTLRDVANQLGYGNELQFQNGQLSIGGQVINPANYGLTNVDGRFQGNADNVAAMFGLQPIRGQFEQNGANVGYENGLITINGVPFDPNQVGAVNIGGRFYAPQQAIDDMYTLSGEGKFNPSNMAPQEGQQEQQEVFQDTTLQSEVQKLQDKYLEVLKDPPKTHTEQINTILDSLKTFKSVYADEAGKLIKSTLASEFSYSPENDAMLQDAAKYANSQIMEQMNARGILNSSMTGDKFQQVYKDLLPQYQNLAYQRYNDNLNMQFKKIDLLNQMNQQDYSKYYQFATQSIEQIDRIDKATYDSFKNNLDLISTQLTTKDKELTAELKKKEAEYNKAKDKLEMQGYVSNDIATTLNLPVGTPSQKAREALDKELSDTKAAARKVITDSKAKQEEREYQATLLKEKVKEKEAVDNQKTMAGSLLANLSQYSGAQALQHVSDNYKYYSDLLGPELTEVVKNLSARKDKDESETLAQERFNLSESNANKRAKLQASKQEQPKTIDDKIAAGLPLSSTELQQHYNALTQHYKSESYDNAYRDLMADKNDLIGTFGVQKFKELYTDVLEDALKYNEDAVKKGITSKWAYITPLIKEKE